VADRPCALGCPGVTAAATSPQPPSHMGATGSRRCLCCDRGSPTKADLELTYPVASEVLTVPKNDFEDGNNNEAQHVDQTDEGNVALSQKLHYTKSTADTQEKTDSNPAPTNYSSNASTGTSPAVCHGQVTNSSVPTSEVEAQPSGSDGVDQVQPTASTGRQPRPVLKKGPSGNSLGEKVSAKFRRSASQDSLFANGEKKSLWKIARTKTLGKAISTTGATPTGTAATRIKCKPSNNSNAPGDYVWLQDVLWNVVKNEAHSLGVVDTATGKGFTPVFFVLGSCPNTFCAMQAVMYSVSRERGQDLDFWWVKPQKSSQSTLERNTLSRNAKGPHKNDPGRSKPFYKAFADLFAQDSAGPPGMRFGIETMSNKAQQSTPRAYLVNNSDGSKLYLYIVWQEDWTSNPFSSKKYIKGKIVYQKEPQGRVFFSRQYCIQSGSVSISEVEERPFKTILPSNDIKELWDTVA